MAAVALGGSQPALSTEKPTFKAMRLNVWHEPRLETITFDRDGSDWRVMLIYSDKTQERLLAKEVNLSRALGLVGKPKRYAQEQSALVFGSARYCS